MVNRKVLRVVGLGLTVFIAGLCSILVSPSGWDTSAQQDLGWKVFVKTSPCSGRFDWVTVAKENPTGRGGLGYWESADLIIGGTGMRCLSNAQNSCTKPQAEAEAEIVRAQPKFRDYCCKEYSVWQNTQTRKMTIVVGKFGNPGPGWIFEDGPMCCEEAEAMTGITGACSGTHGTGTGFGPMTGSTLIGTNLTFYRGTTPEQCQADCRANPQCKGFTLIKAGAYSPNDPPMCYLASAVTGSNNSSCCISGVKGGAGGDKPSAEVDLSGTWQAVITESNTGNTFRYDLVLSRTSAGKWSGTLTLTSSPNASLGFSSAATLESLGGGNMRISYASKGRNQQGTGTYTKDAIWFGGSQNSVRFTRR